MCQNQSFANSGAAPRGYEGGANESKSITAVQGQLRNSRGSRRRRCCTRRKRTPESHARHLGATSHSLRPFPSTEDSKPIKRPDSTTIIEFSALLSRLTVDLSPPSRVVANNTNQTTNNCHVERTQLPLFPSLPPVAPDKTNPALSSSQPRRSSRRLCLRLKQLSSNRCTSHTPHGSLHTHTDVRFPDVNTHRAQRQSDGQIKNLRIALCASRPSPDVAWSSGFGECAIARGSHAAVVAFCLHNLGRQGLPQLC